MKWDSRLTTTNHRIHIFALSALLFCLFAVTGCTQQETSKKVSLYKKAGRAPQTSDYRQPNTFWFGFDLRLGPKEEVRIYTPFLQYLERATGKRFRIKFSEKYEDTVDNLGKGVTHFASLGTLNYVIGANKYGIKYLVSGVNKEGDPRYQAMIITRPDSPVRDLRDLEGKCFAFGAKMSTQGHLIPRKLLNDAGITLENLGNHIYAGSHVEVAKAVINGECDAGGIQDTLANQLVAEKKVKIIQISEPYPSSLIAYNSAVDSKTVEAVRTALLVFDPTGKHQAALFDWDKTEMPMGFSRISEPELNKVMTLANEYGLLAE
jgi:phosphonate transport system substrate-binding protein